MEGKDMNALEALNAAIRAGVEVTLDDNGLVLKALAKPSDAIIGGLEACKAEIIFLLRPHSQGWTAEDWRAFYDERAGIVQHDGGLDCAKAETRTIEPCVSNWSADGSSPICCDLDSTSCSQETRRNEFSITTDGTSNQSFVSNKDYETTRTAELTRAFRSCTGRRYGAFEQEKFAPCVLQTEGKIENV
jgi:hypothetical protein